MTARPQHLTRQESITLAEHFEAKIAALEHLMCVKVLELEKKVEIRLEALDRATSLAAGTLEKRLEGMNEFRGQLRDQSNTFITRAEWNVFKERLDVDIRSLREDRASAQGKASQQSVNVVSFIAVIGLLIGLVQLVMRFV